MFELFEKIIKAFKANEEERFNANVRNWMDMKLPNPYPTGTPQYNLYSKMQYYWRDWRNKTINMRSAKQNMLKHARVLIESFPENPYVDKEISEEKVQVDENPSEEMKPEIPADNTEKSSKEETLEPAKETVVETPAVVANVKKDEKEHIFGVLPSRKRSRRESKGSN